MPKSKKEAALDAIAQRNKLQYEVLQAQLAAANSTISMNERMYSFIGRAEGVLQLMEEHFRKDPVIIIQAQAAGQANDTDEQR